MGDMRKKKKVIVVEYIEPVKPPAPKCVHFNAELTEHDTGAAKAGARVAFVG